MRITYGRFAYCLNSVLNVKSLVGAFNKERSPTGLARLLSTNLRHNPLSTARPVSGDQDQEAALARLDSLETVFPECPR